MKLLNLLKLDSGRHNHTLESNNCCFERPTQQPKKEPKAKNTRPAVIETSDTDTDSDDSANDDP